ncbi:MAG: hypothetical protein DRQ45_06790 [Gammaproteobacteria bacterium]|nr:MAG: hypothetical protein DRQ45_06790 [Gammaproteobacteria bacterium]
MIVIMMQTRLLPNKDTAAMVLLLFALLAGGIFDAVNNTVEAVVFNISNRAVPLLSIRVGSGGSTINRVNFDVSSAAIGNGTPIAGSRRITFRLVIRAPASSPLTAFLTVDSSTPLDNGSGATIPVSEISWTSRDGDIPSGNYAGTSNQLLASFTSSVRVVERQTFSYENRNIYDAGTYNGQVTYTWSAP